VGSAAKWGASAPASPQQHDPAVPRAFPVPGCRLRLGASEQQGDHDEHRPHRVHELNPIHVAPLPAAPKALQALTTIIAIRNLDLP
jgi:hypothetical protein